MDSSGVIGFELCTCPANSNNYDISSDKMRFRLELVTVNPPVANFSGTPTSGSAPLAVNFTDLSTNSPTAWSWTFGDGGTSTVQNPSHTYAAGTYTVSLTATNSAGSDGETKSNYITVTAQEVYVYPYAYNWHANGVGTLIAGGLSDVQTSNNGYMQVRCNASNYNSGLRYEFDAAYTPSQVSKITVEYELRSTRSDQPWYQFIIYKQDGSGGNTPMGGGLWTTTDQWFTWETTAVSTYMSSSGYMHVTMCGCAQNSYSYDTYVDVCRVKLTLN
jgi:PKD repeat protein